MNHSTISAARQVISSREDLPDRPFAFLDGAMKPFDEARHVDVYHPGICKTFGSENYDYSDHKMNQLEMTEKANTSVSRFRTRRPSNASGGNGETANTLTCQMVLPMDH